MSDARIEPFRKMVEADPENELGHFSLGRACLEAGRFEEAVGCLRRVLELNETNSKAYHLLATAQKGAGDTGGALETVRRGYAVAHARGDLMPRNEMAALMRELGEEPPVQAQPSSRPAEAAAGADQVACRRCGRPGPQLPKPPFKGLLGEKVHESICAPCWREWLLMGTKVINELRLDFANPHDSETYDRHMQEFLNLA